MQQHGYPLKILLKAASLNRRAYYRYLKRSRNTIASTGPERRGRKASTTCPTTDGAVVTEEELIQILQDLQDITDSTNPLFYVKTMGDKKLSLYLRDHHKIICNHKKLYRIRKAKGWVRDYRKAQRQFNRSKNHRIQLVNRMWQMDVKYYSTVYEGTVQVLTLFDVYDKWVVGTFIARSITGADVKRTIAQAMDFRKTDGEGLIIRNDHGCQFTSKTIRDFLSDQQVEQEFGILRNPNSQAFVESFHARCTLEFEIFISADTIVHFIDQYKAWLKYYHYIRYHGSLRSERHSRILTPYQFQLEIQGLTTELPVIEVLV